MHQGEREEDETQGIRRQAPREAEDHEAAGNGCLKVRAKCTERRSLQALAGLDAATRAAHPTPTADGPLAASRSAADSDAMAAESTAPDAAADGWPAANARRDGPATDAASRHVKPTKPNENIITASGNSTVAAAASHAWPAGH